MTALRRGARPTALVIDASPAARQQVTGLLELAGWCVHEAADAEDARRLSSAVAPDLVVTSATVPGAADGPGLLTELRRTGSTAHFLVVTPDPTDEVRAAAAAAGALACLAAPVGARLLVDLVRSRTADRTADLVDVADLHDADLDAELDAELQDRLQGMYADALPARLSALSRSVRAGEPRAVAAAAHALAGASGQLGHPEVADVCRAIADDARRGVLAHQRLAQLTGLAGQAAG
ncbi:hypothetical protein GCM10023328_46300 [Modestobacter marinus]|uniref:DNA-binding response OmpR family regulator n=1 Tax=Modestobacter marinus TaxID=477641 RepID=A0A846M263_9ACTN|nr:response regulator [Modestobacter marinus]NIH69739.1 DNA-binding response OmpR family regulator [Modestobacter marinus]GGL65265.1 hypothetical protein GCM10011589_21730 [Modestobacter marinus]